jgi:CheY-like chemotaxis protein
VATLARNGPEALRLAVTTDPQVIVCDVMMPAMDGTEMVCRIRANPVLANVPVVLMSAVLPVSVVPVAAMLRKPFGPSLLLRLVDELTDHSVAGREALSQRT